LRILTAMRMFAREFFGVNLSSSTGIYGGLYYVPGNYDCSALASGSATVRNRNAFLKATIPATLTRPLTPSATPGRHNHLILSSSTVAKLSTPILIKRQKLRRLLGLWPKS
jgi:hypothetical protein